MNIYLVMQEERDQFGNTYSKTVNKGFYNLSNAQLHMNKLSGVYRGMKNIDLWIHEIVITDKPPF